MLAISLYHWWLQDSWASSFRVSWKLFCCCFAKSLENLEPSDIYPISLFLLFLLPNFYEKLVIHTSIFKTISFLNQNIFKIGQPEVLAQPIDRAIEAQPQGNLDSSKLLWVIAFSSFLVPATSI